MHIFHNRPLCFACCIAVACTFSLPLLSRSWALVLIAILALSLIVFFILLLQTRRRPFFLGFLCALLAMLVSSTSFLFFHVKLPRFESLIEREFEMEGTVLKRLSNVTYAAKLWVEVDSINGTACDGDMYVQCAYASALQPGDRFCMRVTGYAEKDETSGEALHCTGLSDGVLLTAICEDADDCEFLGENTSLRVKLMEWNADLSFRLRSSMGEKEGALASALLLGNRNDLGGQTKLDFERSGISHLLALSGLHVSILIGFLEWFLLRLRVCKGGRIAVTASLAIFYLFLTGASPSICRAVLMFGFLGIAYYSHAEYDSLTALSCALVAILLVTPYSVNDLGMWMSFLAAAAIIIFSPIFQEACNKFYERFEPPIWLYRAVTSVIGALFVGIIANLAMLAVLVGAYGTIAWMSIPATMLLSLPISVGLITALATLLFAPIARLCAPCMRLILYLAQRISDMEDVLLPANDCLTSVLSLLVFASMVFLALTKLKRLAWGILPLCLAGMCVASSIVVTYLPNDGVRMDYLIESGGDLLLFTENARAVAVDFSDGTASGALALANAAIKARCTELNDFILSHYHNRATYFLNVLASKIRVRHLHLPDPIDEWELGVAMRLCEEAENLGIAVHFESTAFSIPSFELQGLAREVFPSGRHTALLFSVRINDWDLTYVNASVPSSELLSFANERMEESEILMFGSTGFSSQAPDSFPRMLNTPNEILISDERLDQLLPYLPSNSRVIRSFENGYHVCFP